MGTMNRSARFGTSDSVVGVFQDWQKLWSAAPFSSGRRDMNSNVPQVDWGLALRELVRGGNPERHSDDRRGALEPCPAQYVADCGIMIRTTVRPRGRRDCRRLGNPMDAENVFSGCQSFRGLETSVAVRKPREDLRSKVLDPLHLGQESLPFFRGQRMSWKGCGRRRQVPGGKRHPEILPIPRHPHARGGGRDEAALHDGACLCDADMGGAPGRGGHGASVVAGADPGLFKALTTSDGGRRWPCRLGSGWTRW